MKLSEYIHQYRTSHHLSFREMGDQCNVSHQYINRLEKDEIKKPSLEFLAKIARGMGITTTELLNSVDDFAIDLTSDTDLLAGKNEVLNRMVEKLSPLPAEDLSFIESIVDAYITKFRQ